MARPLPPLNALRAFEAAARHLSFTKAAAELHVTPAAIGQQVKLLEDHLGVALFWRLHRALMLTEAGQTCLPGVRDGFDRLTEAMPRLDTFQAAHPEIDVHIAASMQVVDFSSGEVDLAIRYGGGRYEGLSVERVMTETVLPVCSP